VPRTEHEVVVTGLGVVSPCGHTVSTYADALQVARSGLVHSDVMERYQLNCQVAGVPMPQFAQSTRESSGLDDDAFAKLDRTTAYALVAAVQCWCDAGFQVPPPHQSSVDWLTGVYVGSGVAGIRSMAEWVIPRVEAGEARRLGSGAIPAVMASGPAAAIVGLLGIGGAAQSLSSACASGTQAVIEGVHAIRHGQLERAIVGGAEAESVHAWAGFDAMRVLARGFNSAPTEASRPFSATATGFVPSAGAGFLLLEQGEAARRRGARMYARVDGVAHNAGGQRGGGSMTSANPEGLRRCISGCLGDAAWDVDSVDLVNGHLTGTAGDRIEMQQWRDVLWAKGARPTFQSTKSLLGHALGAAGALECVACALQIAGGWVHPTINCDDLHPDLAWCRDHIARDLQERPVRRVLKLSAGFGDVNACVAMSQV
jgi:3-oxoacyl-(acyl-carrier-protein) synthase